MIRNLCEHWRCLNKSNGYVYDNLILKNDRATPREDQIVLIIPIFIMLKVEIVFAIMIFLKFL